MGICRLLFLHLRQMTLLHLHLDLDRLEAIRTNFQAHAAMGYGPWAMAGYCYAGADAYSQPIAYSL